ncbi:MAG: 50S ribosomal protein L13 [Candidatus Tyloplasma litorale]|nr:MAG: 50S ribosomal protein L13 [Mycoplasmatales bacterium]
MKQTKIANGKNIVRKWYLVDATDLVLGRMSTEVARLLTGKHKTNYTPHEDNGDFVIIINADKIRLTGNKLDQNKGKMYYNHSGYIGGLRTRSAKTMLENYSDEMVKKAIWGMIPHNRLGRQQIKKLFVYSGEEHKHSAQQPEVFEIKGTKAELRK